jgi:hypothetical protein
VYRGLRTDLSDSPHVVPYTSFVVWDGTETMVQLSTSSVSPVVDSPTDGPSETPVSIEGVGELRGATLTTVDGSVIQIGIPLGGYSLSHTELSPEQIEAIARGLSQVDEDDLEGLDARAAAALHVLPELEVIDVADQQIVLRGVAAGLPPAAICVRIAAAETCRPDPSNQNSPRALRLSLASGAVDGRWFMAGYGLGSAGLDGREAPRSICSANADGTITGELEVQTTEQDGVTYFLTEVPDGVDYARLCLLDGDPPSANSSGISIRPG